MNIDTQALLKAINEDLDVIQRLQKSFQEKALMKEDPAPDMGGAPDAPPAAPAEGAPADGWDPGSASNEELLSMIEQLMQVVESRLGGEGDQGGAPAPDMGGAPGAAPAPAGGEPLAQAEGEPDDSDDQGGAPAPDMGGEGGEPAPDMGGGDEGGEPAPDMGGEGEIEMDESPEALQQEIAALSPEDFQKLKAAVDAVSGQGAGGDAAPAQPPMEKSTVPFRKALPKVAGLKPVKSGAHDGSAPASSNNLVKSLTNLCDGLEKLASKVREPAGAPASTYADAGVRVLEKSVSNPDMDGPTLANYLLTEQRRGNKLVKSLHVAQANCAKTPEALHEVYSNLKSAGIQLPK